MVLIAVSIGALAAGSILGPRVTVSVPGPRPIADFWVVFAVFLSRGDGNHGRLGAFRRSPRSDQSDSARCAGSDPDGFCHLPGDSIPSCPRAPHRKPCIRNLSSGPRSHRSVPFWCFPASGARFSPLPWALFSEHRGPCRRWRRMDWRPDFSAVFPAMVAENPSRVLSSPWRSPSGR